jgi:hypothetical protein
MKYQSILLAPVSLLLCALFTACGGGGQVEVTSEQNVFAQIEGLGDAAGNEQLFKEAFVDGAVPNDRAIYAKHWYQVAGDAEFSGDLATVPVKIVGGVASSQEGDNSAASTGAVTEKQATWTLQKVGDSWKIKEAPLS